jgi:DNA-binding beta-propeller fold protein YncE
MTKMFPALFAALFLSGPATALDLTLVRTFESDGPSGLTYDRTYCGLWIANESRTVRMTDTWGNEVRSFEAPLHRVDAIAVTDTGLILSDGSGLYQKVSREGVPQSEPFRLSANLRDTDGLFFDDRTRDYWVADDTAAEIVQISEDGVLRRRLIGYMQQPQLMEPQGVTVDPVHGTVLVVDDADASDSLFEFSPDGVLMSVTSLEFAGYDAEGITVNAEGSQLFVAFDDGHTVAVFDYKPSALAQYSEALPSACVISALDFGHPPV